MEGVLQEVHLAAASGDCPRVESLLSRHPLLLEAANEWGWTPLMQAAAGGQRGLVATLVSHAAEVNALNKLGMSVLDVACASGDLRIVQLLQEQGGRGHLAALCALANGHHQLLHLLVNEDPQEANQVIKISGSSALHVAVATGSVAAVQTLLSKGANPNQRDAAGHTALDLAELLIDERPEVAVMVELLKQVADCKLSKVWSDAVVESASDGDLRRLMVLVSEMNLRCKMRQDSRHSHSTIFSSALLAAAENGHAFAIEVLLNHRLDINTFGHHGMTPLMLAAANGHLEAVERLVAAGADCRLKSSVSGHTAFELAALSENTPPALAHLLAKHTIANAESAPSSPRLGRQQWPRSPQPPHRLLQLPKSPRRPASLCGSPTLGRSERRSTPSKIKHFFTCISNRLSKQED